ncbi:MAG: zinc-ribbon domain-containing protein [Rhodobacteraceae bacterium]|nr:zinc-ribbon domain-containing protein [Paracoccaceae bacterium]
MRLVCPGCGAQYEIDAALLPDTGRDVQCSACGHVWFQHPADPAPSPPRKPPAEPAPEDTPLSDEGIDSETDPGPAPAPKREIDPGVLDVLREEAAYEADQRKREAEALSSQPEFPLDPPQAPSPSVKRAHRPDPAAENRAPSPQASGPDETAPPDRGADPGPRSGLLPDIDSISSTLQPDAMAAGRSQATAAAHAAQGSERSGFLRGFTLVIALAILLFALYIGARPLAEAVPALDPALARYTEVMDTALAWTAEQVNALVAMVSGD